MSEDENKLVITTVRLPLKLLATLNAVAYEYRKSRSELIRDAIQEYLSNKAYRKGKIVVKRVVLE